MLELAGVIRDLRGELERAIVAGEGEALRFEIGPIELEFEVAVERSGEAGGKVRFWVVELGGEGRSGNSDTQRLKLVLTPRLGVGTAYVSGRAEGGEQ